MDLITGFIVVTVLYMWVLFLDRFLKSCSHYGYIQFLKGTGLEIKLLHFKWTTTAFNKILLQWGSKHSYFLNFWFNFGLCISVLLLPVSIVLLVIAFFQNFSWAGKTTEGAIIKPVLPGINLPASEIGYYSITLLISSIFHEIGHALAAVHEDVNVINVGANVMFILPVAYVNINSDKLFSLNHWKQLKILCAGVWHNVFISFLAFMLYICLPYIFSPLYKSGDGIIVSSISEKSPLYGARGLNLGDIIVRINDCEVKNEDAWLECLSALAITKTAFCIEADVVHNFDESTPLKHLDDGLLSCCHPDNKGKLCFEYLDVKDSVLELPPYACLPGRQVVELSKKFCTSPTHSCGKDTYCFRPLLTNYTNLFKIKRVKGDDVIFIGLISDFTRTISVSSYIPKYDLFSTKIPDSVTKFLKYMIMFSTGLAIGNVIPCLFMDGQHIANTMFHIILSAHLRTTHIKFISGICTTFFTFLLVLHCVITAFSKFF